MDIIILCIGTDKCVGDSLGPLVGTDIEKWAKRYKKNIYVYGTLENNVHAKNLDETIKTINEKHKDCYIIAVDACVGKDIGQVFVRNQPIRPGIALGKNLDIVGNISLIGIVANTYQELVFNGVKLNIVMNVKEETCKKIKPIINKLLKKQP